MVLIFFLLVYKEPQQNKVMSKSLNNKKNEEKISNSTSKLIKSNPNHMKCGYGKIQFEVLGGVNHENYQSLRVMLLSKIDRYKQREALDLYDATQVLKYQRKLSEATNTSITDVKDAFYHLIDELDEYINELRENKGKPVVEKIEIDANAYSEAVALLTSKNLLSDLQILMNCAGVVGNENNRMILFLVYLSRKMNKGIHAIVQSDYNYLQHKISQLIPAEELIQISHLSDNALFYYNENELQNKIILVEDTINNRKKIMPLLSFYTHGYISKTTVQKNENLELETFEKKVYGNVSIGISTVNEDAFKLYGNQSVVLHEDTGAMQDEKVLDYQRKQSAGIITTYSENLFISRMQNIQRVLQPITVRNPYALELQLPQQIQQKQITNFQYLKLIEVITFLKQYQRTVKVDETTGEEYIETSLEDIADANELLINIMVTKSDKLNQNTRKFLEKLKEYLINKQARTFTNQELSRNLLTPRSTVKRYLSMLVEFDYVRYTGEGNNKVGLELEMVSMDEYKELIDSVTCIMKTNFSQVDHLQSGQSKGVEKNELSQVVQKNEEVGTLSAEASGINKQKDKLQGVESKTKKRVA